MTVKRYRVILDTNVILAAMRSQTGASHRLLLTIGHPRCQSVITPALMYEYEDVARRPGNAPGFQEAKQERERFSTIAPTPANLSA